jgi:DNA-binding CsgD family transcriptional regulator
MVKENEWLDKATVLRLFRSGMSKAEIGRQYGMDKKQVGNLLAKAIRESGHGAN